MVKHTFLVALLALTACKPHDPNAGNLAAQMVKQLDPKATCVPVYTNQGDQHIHSVTCELGTNQKVYCAISQTQLGLACGPALQVPTTPAPAAAAPAPAQPPTPPDAGIAADAGAPTAEAPAK